MYKVTLSMPIYNVAPYVERALLSALNQTFDSIEFLIVDDRGTDNSMEIVRKIVAEHPRGKDVRIIEHPHNIGTGATKNTAIDNAQGEYLFFMDSDDEVTPDCIEILYRCMLKNNVDLVTGNHKVIFEKGNHIDINITPIMKRGSFSLAREVYIKRKAFCFSTWNKLYSIRFLRDSHIDCYPHHLNEDVIFCMKIIEKVKSFVMLPDVTLMYYERNNSTMNRRSKMMSVKDIEEYDEIFIYQMNSIKQYPENIKSNASCILIGTMLYIIREICVSNAISLSEKRTYVKKFINCLFCVFSDIHLFELNVKNIYTAVKVYVCCCLIRLRLFVQ